MASILQIQEALAERPGARLRAYQIAARTGVTTKNFCKMVGKWMARGHLSRERVKGMGWCYFLTEQQLRTFRMRKALGPGVRCSISFTAQQGNSNAFEESGLVAEIEVVPERLKFLRMLKEKTVFGEHATLTLIIQDYERTLKLRRAIANRVEG
jgi:hypothetical protein